MADDFDEDALLLSVTMENARTVLSERRRVEQELRATKDALQRKAEELADSLAMTHAILEATTDAILATDTGNVVTGFNEKFVSMWGIPAEIIKTMDHSHYLDVSAARFTDPQALLDRVNQVCVSKLDETVDILELRDGTVVQRYSRLQWVEGKIVGRVWTFRDVTQRRLADETIRKSEELSRSIIDSSTDCIHTLSLNGTLLWMSERGRKTLRVDDMSQRLGKPWLGLWQQADLSSAKEALESAAQGQSKNFIAPFEVDGVTRWFDLIFSPILDISGKPEKILAVARDITVSRRIEENLQTSEAHFRELADSMPQIVWVARDDGRVEYFNRRWYEFTGLPITSEVHADWKLIIHPEEIDNCIDLWTESVEKGTLYQIEYRFRNHNGDYRWHLGRAVPIRDERGRVVKWFGSCTDIHDQKSLLDSLRIETNALELLNKTGMALSSTLDVQTLVQAVTDAGTQLSGAEFGAFFYTVKSDDGSTFQLYSLSGAARESFERFGYPRATPIFAPTFKGDPPIRSDDIRQDPRYGTMGPHFGMPPGHLPVASYMAMPVISRTGDVIGGLFFGHSKPGIFTERTERILAGVAAQAAIAIDNARLYEDLRKAEQEKSQLLSSERASRIEAERTSRVKDEFLATLSHELRTPLTSILGWSQILLSSDRSVDDLNQGLQTIARNAKAQTQLIEDLLDMSRIISGKIRLDVQKVNLHKVLEAVFDSMKPAAEAKSIALTKTLDVSTVQISCDPNRLQQIIWNLLSNALKFTPKGGSVEVCLERVESHIEIRVSDSGVGIRPEFLPHVFERFRQEDSSSTRKHGGLGLGLSIVKQLVELHGGSVHAHSSGIGLGARFVVNLPLASNLGADSEAPSARAPAKESKFIQIDLSGVKVLVVDDENDARMLVRRALMKCKAEVITASSAAEGLSLLISDKPHVLLSDIGMPEKNGYQFINEIRSLSPEEGRDIPAAALTAFVRSEDQAQALMAGFQLHISKPIEPSQLVAAVATLLKLKKSQKP